jgi:hypothetical protein
MAKIIWGAIGARGFEVGADRGVLYPPSGIGVPWNGLISVDESPTGGEPKPYYLDGIKYLQVASAEEFDASIKAFSAPTEFDICDGTAALYAGLFITQQPRKQFGFAYRTLIGNDVDGSDHGYKIHIVYNALAKPTSRNNQSIGASTEPIDLSWDISTVPPTITGVKPSAHIVISSLTASSAHLIAVENILYGTDTVAPRQPTIAELITIFGS